MDRLSIILPVYNEFKSLPQVLTEWKNELVRARIPYQFIICEDGSTDGTSELLPKIKRKYNLDLNQKNFRRGYGQAVIDGIKSARTNYILCIDSDGQCDPKDVKKFWDNRLSEKVIIGWRKTRQDAGQRKIFSGCFKVLYKILFPTPIHDPSAPFVLFQRKKIMPYLKYMDFLVEGFWWGFIGVCVKAGIEVGELSMNHRLRLNGETQVYKPDKIVGIALKNIYGLFKLKFAQIPKIITGNKFN